MYPVHVNLIRVSLKNKFKMYFFLSRTLFLATVGSFLEFQIYHQLELFVAEVKCLTVSTCGFRSYYSSSALPNTAGSPCWRGGGPPWRRSRPGTAALRHSPVLLWLRTKDRQPSSPHTHSIFSNIIQLECTHHFLFHLIYSFPAHFASKQKDESRLG